MNKTVPVLLSSSLLNCIKLIIKYRGNAGVPEKNRYVFGIPSSQKLTLKYLRACKFLREFAFESRANLPETLRGTTLRKHIAKNCIHFNLTENEVTDAADFMGHSEKIHKNYYC